MKIIKTNSLSYFSLCFSVFICLHGFSNDSVYQFTEKDIAFLKRLSLTQLSKPHKSHSNQYADNLDAAKLGHHLFFDKNISSNQQVSCATCHQPKHYFTDALSHSIAVGKTERSAPTILGSAWSPWLFWDGRKDSLWSQSLAPLEDANEHNFTRVLLVKHLAKNYKNSYETIFGKLPSLEELNKIPDGATPQGDAEQQALWRQLSDTLKHQINIAFVNAGKAMMAYQRQVKLPKAPFDHFIDALGSTETNELASIYSPSATNGLRLFVGKANCASCHNGPLLTNFEFHNIGAPEADINHVDLGRFKGVKQLVDDEFTCLSPYSDAKTSQCSEMRFLKKEGPELVGAFKTPTLRNIAKTAPYMQQGQFESLEQVIAHYNFPIPPFYDRKQHPNRPHFDILPLKLTAEEITDLTAFLHTLTSPFPTDDQWWSAPITPLALEPSK